ncbi:MAG: hypothetical protein ACOC5T_01055 [Elusimicrobiota bacterium]
MCWKISSIKKKGPEYWDKLEKSLDKGETTFGLKIHDKCIKELREVIKELREEYYTKK